MARSWVTRRGIRGRRRRSRLNSRNCHRRRCRGNTDCPCELHTPITIPPSASCRVEETAPIRMAIMDNKATIQIMRPGLYSVRCVIMTRAVGGFSPRILLERQAGKICMPTVIMIQLISPILWGYIRRAFRPGRKRKTARTLLGDGSIKWHWVALSSAPAASGGVMTPGKQAHGRLPMPPPTLPSMSRI